MIHTIRGNVLDIDTGIIVHSCNNMGVMGSGIAKEIKARFPKAYSTYANEYASGRAALGSISVAQISSMKFIINGIGQNDYGRDGNRYVSYDAIVQIFEKVDEFAYSLEMSKGLNLPICFPMIGAGLGGGDWDIISTIIDKTVSPRFEKRLYTI